MLLLAVILSEFPDEPYLATNYMMTGLSVAENSVILVGFA